MTWSGLGGRSAGAHMASRNSQDGAIRKIVMGVRVPQAKLTSRMHVLIGGTAWYDRDYVDDTGWLCIHFGGMHTCIYAISGIIKLSITKP